MFHVGLRSGLITVEPEALPYWRNHLGSVVHVSASPQLLEIIERYPSIRLVRRSGFRYRILTSFVPQLRMYGQEATFNWL
jgi:hypothetical protein